MAWRGSQWSILSANVFLTHGYAWLENATIFAYLFNLACAKLSRARLILFYIFVPQQNADELSSRIRMMYLGWHGRLPALMIAHAVSIIVNNSSSLMRSSSRLRT